MSDNFWFDLAPWGAVVATLAVVFVQIIYQRKNLKMKGLALVFAKLNGENQRAARKAVLTRYRAYLKKRGKLTKYSPDDFEEHLEEHPTVNIVELDKSVEKYVEQVRSDYEEIAIMAKNGLVDKRPYFDAYWGSMLRCYMAIHGYIESRRDESGEKDHTLFFEQLCKNNALKYWREHHSDSKIIFYSDKQEQTRIDDF